MIGRHRYDRTPFDARWGTPSQAVRLAGSARSWDRLTVPPAAPPAFLDKSHSSHQHESRFEDCDCSTLGPEGSPKSKGETRDHAIRTCAPGGGFVLHPVDQIFSDTPMENVRIMIDRWKEVGRYPISL